MGLRPWRKLTCEECVRFTISSLTRAGLFRAPPGTLCNSMWKDSDGKELLRIYFSWHFSGADGAGLSITDGKYGVARIPPQAVEIVYTRLSFGSRRWFQCPGLPTRTRCDRRAGILYLPPNASRFACRMCHNLVHRSAQEHDKRVDALLRLSVEDFQSVLEHGTIRQRLLAVHAGTVLRERLRVKAVRYLNRRSNRYSPASIRIFD
jgi:hypothetical protein